MGNFIYQRLVGNMSDDAFQFCVKSLYTHMNYKYVSQDEVRKVDMMEYLGNMEKKLKSEIKAVSGSADLYLYMIKQYFTSVIKCKENSRAEKYKQRAMSIIRNFKTSNNMSSDIDDVFVIFTSLMRCEKCSVEEIRGITVLDRTFDVYIEDADLIKRIYSCFDITPKFLCEYKELGVSVRLNQMALREYFYFINILYLAKSLEERGILGEE